MFFWFPYFLHDPLNVSNLIPGSSAASKPKLYIWKFSVHILLKPSLKDFEHNLTSMWNECNSFYMVIWTFFETTDCFKIGKGVRQGCVYCHLACLTYMQSTFMQNVRLDESQAEIKIAGRNQLQICGRYHANGRKWRNYRASWWGWKRRVKKLA